MQSEDREPPISRIGYRVYGLLGRRGGVLRLRPLMRDSGLDDPQIRAAINELTDRYRITVTWRKSVSTSDPTRRRVLADVERITLTRLGRNLLWRTAIGD
jgi:hypothetical protein